MAERIRKDDTVVVIAGDHRGQRGKVLRLLPDKQRVVVEGVNMVYRHVRKSQRNPQGGRVQKEAPLHISNVLPVDAKSGRGARVRFDREVDNRGQVTRKRRVTVGGTVLDTLSRHASVG